MARERFEIAAEIEPFLSVDQRVEDIGLWQTRIEGGFEAIEASGHGLFLTLADDRFAVLDPNPVIVGKRRVGDRGLISKPVLEVGDERRRVGFDPDQAPVRRDLVAIGLP